MIKVLSINDEEKFIRIADLIQIMEDYGIMERNTEPAQNKNTGGI